MKRIKVRDYKDRNVFGVPLQVIVQRTSQPLPQGIQQAMRYLRNHCLDQVTIKNTRAIRVHIISSFIEKTQLRNISVLKHLQSVKYSSMIFLLNVI